MAPTERHVAHVLHGPVATLFARRFNPCAPTAHLPSCLAEQSCGTRGGQGLKKTRWVGAMSHHDRLSTAERSERMSRIRSVNTKPEMIVRRLVHSMGYRYRLHARDLPGTPDLVFGPRKKVIFVNGCFWHQHGCRRYRQPRTKTSFWDPKLARNKVRDQAVRAMLREKGWKTLTIWECHLTQRLLLANRIRRFLG